MDASDWSLETWAGTWSGWRDAYRLVTDGRDLIAEKEPMAPEPERYHAELIEEFLAKHPERQRSDLVIGWLVPTADGSGYGLLHYTGEDETLEAARRVAEEWAGKPVHLLETSGLSGQAWQDPARYAIYPEGGDLVDPA